MNNAFVISAARGAIELIDRTEKTNGKCGQKPAHETRNRMRLRTRVR